MIDDIIKSDHESDRQPQGESVIEPNVDNSSAVINGSGKSPKKKPFIIIGSIFVVLILGFGLFQWLGPGGIFRSKNNDQPLRQSIVIGDTKITPSDIGRYAKGIENYKKQRPTVVINGEPKQVAFDDLVMHAALLKEAKENNLSLTDNELRELYKIPTKTSIKDYYKYKEANKSSDGVDYYEGVTQENGLLRKKLDKKLIRDQNLFYVSVNFDSPFFNKQKDTEKLQQLHTEAKSKLQNEILPLFEKGATKAEIIKSVDVNNIDTTKQDFAKIADLYTKQLVVSANEIKNYASSNENIRYINLKELGKTNGQSVSQSFRDLDVDYGFEVPDLKNTNEEIAKLQKDGDHTTVFASKTGTYMIARLEKTGGGDYSTWQAFLDKYKNDYVPKDFKVSLSAMLNKVFAISAQPFNIITSAFDQKAKAQGGPPDGCGRHNLSMSVAMIDRSGAGVNGSVYIGQLNGTHCHGSPRVNGNGYALTTGNCWNGNTPYFGGTAPSGYRIVGYIPGNYTVEGANNTGDYNAYVVVEPTNNRTINGTSSMVSDDGSSFGGGRSAFSHTITYSNIYPYLSNDYSVSGSWNVSGGQSSYTITASAPGSFTTNRGTWNVIGSTTKDRPANAGNNWHADIQFRYTLSGCTGNCCPGSSDPSCNPPETPTCSLSVSPVGTLGSDGSGTVTVSWSSTNNQQGSITGIGDLGRVGEVDSRFRGSQQVNIGGPTTFTGTWTNTDANPDRSVSCSDSTGSGPPQPSSPMLQPYMRAYGNDVIVGSVFKNDAGECDTSSTNQGITGVTGSEIVDGKRVFTGASGQFAVFSNIQGEPGKEQYGGIKQFFSDNQRSTASVDYTSTPGMGPALANDLTFGNHYSRYIPNSTGHGGDSKYPGWFKINSFRVPGYGGNSGVVMCIPNYYGDTQAAGVTPVTGGRLSEIPSEIASSLTDPIADGQRKVLLVDGDLFIDKDIKYENTSWDSVSDIPNVTVIVKGNISIDKDVTQLDGTYVAQPKNSDSGNNPDDGGLIYTCSQQNDPYTVGQLRDNCGKQLVINGSFISKKVIFHRTKGSVRCMELLPPTVPCEPAEPNEPASSENIAEVFNFSPEAYMTPLNVSLQTAVPFQKYDSITSLPPVF